MTFVTGWPGSAVAAPGEQAGWRAAYVGYGMPMPPKDAVLVEVDSGARTVPRPGVEIPHIHLGFQLEPATAEAPATVMIGPLTVQVRADQVLGTVDVEAEDFDVERYTAEWFHGLGVNVGVGAAVQLSARGHDGAADVLMKKALTASTGHGLGAFYQPPDRPPVEAIAHLAWAYWGTRVEDVDTPLSRIVGTLSQTTHVLPQDAPWAPWRRAILSRWRAALIPSVARAGSVVAAIDALVEARSPLRDRPDPARTAVENLGFAAAESLIAHLDDPRATRTLMQAMNNFAPRPVTVGEAASEILQALAGDALGNDWLGARKGYVVKVSEAKAWWESMQGQDEAGHYRARVLPGPTVRGSKFPNALMLRLLGARAPEMLADVYGEVLEERPDLESHPIATAIAASALARDRKVAALGQALTHARLEHRRAAMWSLLKLDKGRVGTALVDTLDALPSTPLGPYWRAAEAAFATLAMEVPTDAVWAALRSAVARADLGLRMELLGNLHLVPRHPSSALTKARALLASYLGSAAVRDVSTEPTKYSGPIAAMRFPTITVGNFVASRLGAD
ncbi:MAG: hypothetical protein ACI9MR_002044, partial [Myxococcota bacterium]